MSLDASVGPSSLLNILPSQDLALLQDMKASVQQAYRELQAADAAASAVAQVHDVWHVADKIALQIMSTLLYTAPAGPCSS